MKSYGIVAEIADTVFYQAIGGLSFEQVIKKSENAMREEKYIFY
jgi:hypothetical protein